MLVSLKCPNPPPNSRHSSVRFHVPVQYLTSSASLTVYVRGDEPVDARLAASLSYRPRPNPAAVNGDEAAAPLAVAVVVGDPAPPL